MIVFTTLHNDLYKSLADITLEKNKKIYCEKHNYPLVVKTDNWHNICIGFEKAYLIQDALNMYPDCEWIFFSECDTVITNMNIRLEDIVKNEEKHFVITTDLNGINAGSFFIKNSHEGKQMLETMMNSMHIFEHEQDFIKDAYYGSKKFQNIISIYPQKAFNSYEYISEFYSCRPDYNELCKGLDYYGNDGNWKDGDFIIHFPGMGLEERLVLANKYLSKNNDF